MGWLGEPSQPPPDLGAWHKTAPFTERRYLWDNLCACAHNKHTPNPNANPNSNPNPNPPNDWLCAGRSSRTLLQRRSSTRSAPPWAAGRTAAAKPTMGANARDVNDAHWAEGNRSKWSKEVDRATPPFRYTYHRPAASVLRSGVPATLIFGV